MRSRRREVLDTAVFEYNRHPLDPLNVPLYDGFERRRGKSQQLSCGEEFGSLTTSMLAEERGWHFGNLRWEWEKQY
jgi:hypothetical protein